MSELFCEVARIAGEHHFTHDLMWDGDLNPSIDVSDLFYWACGDSEDVTEENLPILKQAIDDVSEVCSRSVSRYAPVLFAARVRNLRPQGKYISDYLRIIARDADGNAEWVMNMERFNNATKRNGVNELKEDPIKTQQLKDLFLTLPERPVDIGNPYTPEGNYEYTSEGK